MTRHWLLDITYPAANTLIGVFEERGILEEMTGMRRSRMFVFLRYYKLFLD